jgi:Fe-S cluster assembly protein SufD
VIGARTQASLIETYAGPDDAVYFTNAVTEIVAQEDSVLHHHKVQREGIRAFHIANLFFHQARNGTATSHSISFGGALVRNDVTSVLSEGAECTLNGLYLAEGKQHVDNHTAIDHAKPHAASHELYKGILNGHATAVFNGKVIVEKDAQKTDAKQTNRNLLLSGDAVINTKPELQIYADDVRCTHGATIGQLEENALFYLRSRGIGKEDAQRLLVHAFAREILDRIKLKDLWAVLDQELDTRLRRDASEAA